MNITLIIGPLAILSILYTSVQGQIWPLTAAEVRDKVYEDFVVIEKTGRNYFIHAVPENAESNVPKIVHGPFQVRGFGPYSMLMRKMWLNTDVYVTITFRDIATVRKFYRVLNPHHSKTFPSYFAIKELMAYSPNTNEMLKVEVNTPKAFDLFSLETSAGVDSKVRSYVVHHTEGDQEPILIFHSLEADMTVDGDALELSIYPLNSAQKFRFRIEFQNASTAKRIVDAYSLLNSLATPQNLRDLEALSRNTYPAQPNYYVDDESSSAAGH